MRRPARRISPLSGALRSAHPRRQGLTSDEIAARFAAQGGRCMVCARPMPEPQADHDHALARVHGHDPSRGCKACFRWLACGPCNRMLAGAEDDARTLRSGASLLDMWRAEHPLP